MASNHTLTAEELRAPAAMSNEGGKQGLSSIRRIQDQAVAGLGFAAEAGRQVMQSMALDPISARRQAIDTVRNYPYFTTALLLGFIALNVNVIRS